MDSNSQFHPGITGDFNSAIPKCDTVLFKGPYHPFTPVHFALSNASHKANSSVILLSSSRAEIVRGLKSCNGKASFGTGAIMGLASNVQLMYPPTPAHLALLLSMIPGSDPDGDVAWNRSSSITSPPSLVILHEPSAYFLPKPGTTWPSSQSWTLSSYMTLVAHALHSLSSIHASGSANLRAPDEYQVKLALFDSGLDRLRLPIERTPVDDYQHLESEEYSSRQEPVFPYVLKYFEIVMEFQQESTQSGPDGVPPKTVLSVFRGDVLQSRTACDNI